MTVACVDREEDVSTGTSDPELLVKGVTVDSGTSEPEIDVSGETVALVLIIDETEDAIEATELNRDVAEIDRGVARFGLSTALVFIKEAEVVKVAELDREVGMIMGLWVAMIPLAGVVVGKTKGAEGFVEVLVGRTLGLELELTIGAVLLSILMLCQLPDLSVYSNCSAGFALWMLTLFINMV